MRTMMHHRRLSRGAAVLLLLTIIFSLIGCNAARRPAPEGEPPVSPQPAPTPPAQTLTAALFFADWQAQHLIPEERTLPKQAGAELATQIVRELLAGPTDPHLLRPIPGNVTLLEPVSVQGGVAIVNLSREFLGIQGSAGINMALGALRLSLTELEGVQRVEVLVDGKRGAEVAGMVLEPMDRGRYDYPVLPDPQRAEYLKGRFAQGLDPWRADPLKVARWEGRMFGFTAAELAAAQVQTTGDTATVTLTSGGTAYAIKLSKQGPIWTVGALEKR